MHFNVLVKVECILCPNYYILFESETIGFLKFKSSKNWGIRFNVRLLYFNFSIVRILEYEQQNNISYELKTPLKNH